MYSKIVWYFRTNTTSRKSPTTKGLSRKIVKEAKCRELLQKAELILIKLNAYIKFISGIVVGSSFTSSDGALYIYLKKGNEPIYSYKPSMQSKLVKGYDMAKEFFNPDYNKKNDFLQIDKRTTLYWNPYLTTEGANNKIKIEYYNNDISKKLLLTIEGFNEEGKLIHIEKEIDN